MYISGSIINEATDQILNAREFCGDEKEAVRAVCDDHNIRRRSDRNKVWRIAKYRANGRWNQYKRQAGVAEKYLF